MLRISLSESQQAQLQALRRTNLAAVARDRLEMVLLSVAGWSAPRIAAHLHRHPHTVRAVPKRFADCGTQASNPDAPGREPDFLRRAEVTGKLTELLGQDRTWTARQLAETLGPEVGIGHRQTHRYLVLLKAGYRRTAQTVGQRQDLHKVQRAKTILASLKESPSRPLEAVLPGRERVQPVAADRLLVVSAQVTQAGTLRIPAGPAGQCAGHL